jgi:hypothetical protein
VVLVEEGAMVQGDLLVGFGRCLGAIASDSDDSLLVYPMSGSMFIYKGRATHDGTSRKLLVLMCRQSMRKAKGKKFRKERGIIYLYKEAKMRLYLQLLLYLLVL